MIDALAFTTDNPHGRGEQPRYRMSFWAWLWRSAFGPCPDCTDEEECLNCQGPI